MMSYAKKLLFVSIQSALLPAWLCAAASGFTEPHVIVYGQVLHLDGGNRHLIQDGELSFTLVNKDNESLEVSLSTELTSVGLAGDLCYEVRIPQQYLPSLDDSNTALAVSSVENDYIFESITVDGVDATYFDVSQACVTTSFLDKAQQHRLDIVVSYDYVDSDEDEIPDWWEELYGYNALYGGDATLDEDDDGWDNLEEYLNGTRPDEDNRVPQCLTSTIYVVPGSRSGLYLNMQDSNANPATFWARLKEMPEGLTAFAKFSTSTVLEFTVGQSVVYLDHMQEGVYYMEVDEDFAGGTAEFQFNDQTGNTNTFYVDILPFTPSVLPGNAADVWYDASATTSLTVNGTAVEEWTDLATDLAQDAYQPIAGSEPTYDSGTPNEVDLDGSQYFFIDDTDLDLSSYTLFMASTPSSLGADDQVLFSTNDVEVRINGSDSDSYVDVLQVTESGLTAIGTEVHARDSLIFSYSSDQSNGQLSNLAQTIGMTSASTDTLSPVFATLGARYDILNASVDSFFNGSLHEVIVFPEVLSAELKSRVDDYFVARWSEQEYTVWDFRFETSGVTIDGRDELAHLFSGGWGNDIFVGGNRSDIFRTGEGDDTMTGGSAADVFQLFNYEGTKTITDFDPTEGDVIDLTPLYVGLDGVPDDYITVSLQVTRLAGEAPSVDTVLSLALADGSASNQEIVLQGATYTQDDLKWLVGEGAIILGGPDYVNAVSLTAESTVVDELPNSFSIVLTRTGNLDAAQSMTVNIAGTATLDEDYGISGLTGSGANRTLEFDRGASEVTISIVPVVDTFDETESIRLSILPATWLGGSTAPALELVLEDAEWLKVETIEGYAERLLQSPGVVRVSRSGNFDEMLSVSLLFTGTAENGIDFEHVVPHVVFDADETYKDIELTPIATGNIAGGATVAQVSIIPNTEVYNLLNPWTASVTFVDRYTGGVSIFEDYVEQHQIYPEGEEYSDSLLEDHDEDGILNLMEYALGTDPNVKDDGSIDDLTIYNMGDRFEVWAYSDEDPLDLRSTLMYTYDLVEYHNAENLFDLVLEPQSDGRILRRYVSKFPTSDTVSRFFTLSYEWVDAVRNSGDAAYAIFEESRAWRYESDGERLLVSGDVGWVPLIEEEGLVSGDIGDDQTSGFITDFVGPATVEFEWKVSSEYDYDYLVFYVDGEAIDEISGETDWASFQHTVTGEGSHRVELRYEKDEIVTDGLDRGYVRRFDVDPD